MPIISGGGGGGGNTTAQVVASGKVLPVAKATGVTVDTTTYTDPVAGSGKLTTLVFPTNAAMLAVAVSGDAFPRWLFAATPAGGGGLYMGDGTLNPWNSGAYIQANGPTGGTYNLGMGNEVGATPATDPANFPALSQLSPKGTITAGGLPTLQLVSGTGVQILSSRDAETVTTVQFNPGVATTATCAVELSADNVTYTSVGVETAPAGTVFDGTVRLVKARVPAGWYLKLTVNAQATLGLTTYY